MTEIEERKAVNLIAELATKHNAIVVRRHGLEVLLAVNLFRSDGRRVNYRIVAVGNGSSIKAREEAPIRLPRFCPERHINSDSTFCMNWQAGDPNDVVE